MEHSEDEKGTAQVLLKRLVDQRLPRLMELRDRTERGELLTDFDIEFLEGALNDAQHNERYAANFPEYTALVAKIAQLYEQITSKALENQQTSKR